VAQLENQLVVSREKRKTPEVSSMIYLFFLLATSANNLPANLLSSVCFVESRHTEKAVHYNDGHSHTYGICQVKLETAKAFGFKGDQNTLLLPEVNISYAGKILKYHLTQCKSLNSAILAYSSGRCGRGHHDYLRKVRGKLHEENSIRDFRQSLEFKDPAS